MAYYHIFLENEWLISYETYKEGAEDISNILSSYGENLLFVYYMQTSL